MGVLKASGEQASGGYADDDERPVVRAAGEVGGVRRQAAASEESFEQVLDLGGAGRTGTGAFAGGVVTVVDADM
ncbi:hypothetical protein M2302_002872 [Micromonospora sp. A200]|nr:hypothetical protein [Micromonospora sp. A200]